MNYITELVNGISLLSASLLIAGIILIVAEIFVPKIGLIGIMGIVSLCAGLSSYYIDGFKLTQMGSMLAIIAVILLMFIFVELILEGAGVIKNPNRYQFRKHSLNGMIGKTGVAITNIDMGGTVEIGKKLYYATSLIKIDQGKKVTVVGVNQNTLIVEE